MPTAAQIDGLVERACRDMPILASVATIQRVAAANPDSFWAIRRRGESKQSQPTGFVAFLLLSETGRTALLTGKLKPAMPEPDHLVAQNQQPAAIYVWALHARGILSAALSLVMDKLQSPRYRAADFIARAATAEGAAFLAALGFSERREASGLCFHHFSRQQSLPPSISVNTDTAILHVIGGGGDNRPHLQAKTVHSFDELMRVFAIRAAVYVGEEKCPFDEEFEGNDFSATHIAGYVGGEPAGCLRVRYFAHFAKLERLAVRHNFRGLGLARELVAYATELCRLKGYAALYAHVRSDKVAFWKKFGFAPVSGSTPFVFSDFSYVEMTAALSPSSDTVTVGVDPYILLRREGEWDRPGILELSANRSSFAA